MRYRNRREAGRLLAGRVTERVAAGGLPDPVVLGLPRGGLPVADEVARALEAPLDVLVVRKLGAPFQPELAVGAVASAGPVQYDAEILGRLGLSEADMAPVAEAERAELRRREELYRSGRPRPAVRGRGVVVVDDGLATGSTSRAALRALRHEEPARLLLAVPVCAPEAAVALSAEADEVVCLDRPPSFGAVGFWYDDFAQLSDEDVLAILRGAR